jgi:hypothetical protein
VKWREDQWEEMLRTMPMRQVNSEDSSMETSELEESKTEGIERMRKKVLQ